MKQTILAASIRTVQDGLATWTVEAVARRAGCAKGSVPYHFGSKRALLQATAKAIGAAHLAVRTQALAGPQPAGAAALDSLWAALTNEVDSGAFAGWNAVMSDPALRAAALEPMAGAAGRLATLLARALDVPADAMPTAEAVHIVLDGCQSRLLQGAPAPAVRDAHDRLWLSLIS